MRGETDTEANSFMLSHARCSKDGSKINHASQTIESQERY